MKRAKMLPQGWSLVLSTEIPTLIYGKNNTLKIFRDSGFVQVDSKGELSCRTDSKENVYSGMVKIFREFEISNPNRSSEYKVKDSTINNWIEICSDLKGKHSDLDAIFDRRIQKTPAVKKSTH
jgi:hypothetical protein